jgi:uncharacterized protein
MIPSTNVRPGQFCWVDLAATDSESAQTFYRRLFGWTPFEQPANGGVFTRLKLDDREVGSVYQLQQAHLDRGVPSHWTPYVQVADVDVSARHAAALGGQVLVRPVVIAGMARIAIIVDPVGAHLGLWQSLQPHCPGNGHDPQKH